MMLTGPFNATRHPQKPVPQPTYSFAHVPHASSDLQCSSLHDITNREHFHEAMAEMLLLCKEAIRRRPGASGGGGKPLSLEYLADRLDIDDPCFGFLVRTNEQLGRRDRNWKKGMLQGFITVTTFTNWQRSFRWDSFNEAAYECDCEEELYTSLDRKKDTDGSLSRALQATVRCGDINMEGIVWPRIAEISLLGGLGCGKTLVKLVIERLEGMKSTSKANYDYVVLQATDNSIPFYESLGFVRVGAVMLDEMNGTSASSKLDGDDSDESPFVTSKIMSYKVTSGETFTRIAAKFEVDVWDVLFLNRYVLGDALPSSKPKIGSLLLIPAKEEAEATSPTQGTKWYISKDNDTPRIIAKLLNVSCLDIVNANKSRLPGLMSNSRLKEGTRVKVSNFESPDSDYSAYAHWSFPGSEYEDAESSYMMARKLNRRKHQDRDNRPFETSLKAPVLPYEPSSLLLPPSPPRGSPVSSGSAPPQKLSSSCCKQGETKPPKRPQSAYKLFAAEQRSLFPGKSASEIAKIARSRWTDLSKSLKDGFVAKAAAALEQYQKELSEYEANNPTSSDQPAEESLQIPMSERDLAYKTSLYNKVVRLKPGAMTEGSDYTYWYVLTYIPDLKWCHLAPMIQDGTFGPDRPKATGKPKWKLVDESLGEEVDISSSFCIPINSRSLRNSLDADKEEWDIIDDGSDPTKISLQSARTPGYKKQSFPSISRGTTAVKPSVERSRKKSITHLQSPTLFVTLPGSGKLSTVRIVGKNLFETNTDNESPRKRGRPIGSKNKPKPESPASAPVAVVQFDIRKGSSTSDGKKRRGSLVQVNTPASARKAAALRTTSDKKPQVKEHMIQQRSLSTIETEHATSLPKARVRQREREVASENTTKSNVSRARRSEQSTTVQADDGSEETSDSSCSAIASVYEESESESSQPSRRGTRRSSRTAPLSTISNASRRKGSSSVSDRDQNIEAIVIASRRRSQRSSNVQAVEAPTSPLTGKKRPVASFEMSSREVRSRPERRSVAVDPPASEERPSKRRRCVI